MRNTALLAAFACLALPGAAAADSFYERTFAPPCWARTYDAAHLAAHPRQRVTRFYVTDAGFEFPSGPDSFVVGIGFQVKGSNDTYESAAACGADGDGASCGVEGDAGTFRLEAHDDGILVRIGSHLTVEGLEGFSPNLAEGGDDAVLLLHRSPTDACSLQ